MVDCNELPDGNDDENNVLSTKIVDPYFHLKQRICSFMAFLDVTPGYET